MTLLDDNSIFLSTLLSREWQIDSVANKAAAAEAEPSTTHRQLCSVHENQQERNKLNTQKSIMQSMLFIMRQIVALPELPYQCFVLRLLGLVVKKKSRASLIRKQDLVDPPWGTHHLTGKNIFPMSRNNQVQIIRKKLSHLISQTKQTEKANLKKEDSIDDPLEKYLQFPII